MVHFSVQWKAQSIELDWSPTSTIGNLKEYIAEQTGVETTTQKLLYKGTLKNDDATLEEAKVKDGARIMLVGSSKDDLKQIRDIDEHAARRAKGQLMHDRIKHKPTRRSGGSEYDDQYTFHAIEVIPEFPEPEKARRLLERLRDDKGIRGIMNHYKWSVGVLSELTPFETSILGYNRNAGQLIAVRLRTDDLSGFRHYDSIRKVLLHELTHNVWSEHDENFRSLLRQLNKDVISMDWTAHGGRSLSNGKYYSSTPNGAETVENITASVPFQGTSHRLGGQSVTTGLDADARRELVLQAVMRRFDQEMKEMDEGCGSTK
ncbi:hypothetical protein BZG36_03846 [Bifiguratus adelaidae]|uniref:WLM domain-containing protein n=1 Tax=Bifiguratus adelaidae TaxID=1938954 RepID=A0A261XWU9_9FUNG|nr:hypothetical protein BZG36_03846 [Bifiguratus adelaidae]